MTMRSLSLFRRVAPVAAVLLAAACDGGGTEPDPRLTLAQVSGVYKVCALYFDPIQNALPEADLLSTIIDDAPPAPKQPPSLTVSGTTTSFQLIYTRFSDSFTQQYEGNVALGSETILLTFGDETGTVRRELLLPGQLLLHFGNNPRRLAAVGETTYSVRRADYAQAARISQEGLQDRINGTIYAQFTTGTCQ
jgi:hypothetical protein